MNPVGRKYPHRATHHEKPKKHAKVLHEVPEAHEFMKKQRDYPSGTP
jgi:hypothetical protein